MKKAKDLSELLTEQLRKLYSAEQQQLAVVPTLSVKAYSPDLRNVLHDYRKTKSKNIDRINQCFDELDIFQKYGRCEVIEELTEDCKKALGYSAEQHVADAALVATMQQINHFNIAGYGTASSYARALQKERVARILHDTLLDEKIMDENLSRIAEESINPAAVSV